MATDALEAVRRGDHPLVGEDSVELADLLDDPLLATTTGAESQLRELHARAGVPYRLTQHIRELGTLLTRDLAEPYPAVSADDDMAIAPRLFVERRLPALLVLDADRRPWAIVPGSQLLRIVLATTCWRTPRRPSPCTRPSWSGLRGS
ncbi:hypothetical protein OH779_39765 [Actinacidiphila glaucinigra]|uniref:hypothetical protein n=1 Tax=Actinacidiphila glaucinigra TaxID=235986 RepID=UPI00386EE0A8